MRKCIFFFFCVSALAACSPKTFSGVQEARAFTHTQLVDSVYLRSWLEARMQQYIQQSFERVDSTKTETVREILSAPDSAGNQYVVERSTTSSVSGSSTKAGKTTAVEQQILQEVDSTAVRDSVNTSVAEIREEYEQNTGKRAPWCPWYVYLGGLLVALVLGVYLGSRGKKWIGGL